MEYAYIYAAIELILGLVLLFFGLRFIKVSVAIVGFLFGYAMTMLALLDFQTTLLITTIGVIVGALCAVMAFRFYIFAMSLVIAFFAGNLAYAIATVYHLDVVLTTALTVGVGLLAFIVVRVFKIVEAMFVFATSVQGASAVVAAVFIFLHPGRVEFMQQHSVSVLFGVSGWWLAVWGAVALAGFVSQLQYLHRHEQPAHES